MKVNGRNKTRQSTKSSTNNFRTNDNNTRTSKNNARTDKCHAATTSPLHTALKIAPVYHAPVIHLKDASQNATVAAKLMNPKTKEELEEELHEKYRQLCEKNWGTQLQTVSLEEARKNKLKLF